MADDIEYECPHCKHVVRVSPGVVGDTVECPECDQQFEAEVPHAHVVNPGGTEIPGTEKVATEADAERTLRTVHPAVFRSHMFLTLVASLILAGGVVILVLGIAGTALFGLTGVPVIIVGGVLMIAALIYFLYRWVQALATTLEVTTDRTILKMGLISKRTSEVQHDDIRNIQSDRNVLERLFNYGDIALSSSGQDDMEIVIKDVPDPEGIINIIRQHQ